MQSQLRFQKHCTPLLCVPPCVSMHTDTQGPTGPKKIFITLCPIPLRQGLNLERGWPVRLVSTPLQCCVKGKHGAIRLFLHGDLNSALTLAQQAHLPQLQMPLLSQIQTIQPSLWTTIKGPWRARNTLGQEQIAGAHS